MNGVSSEGERDGNCLLLSGLVFLVLDFLGCEFLAESRLISLGTVACLRIIYECKNVIVPRYLFPSPLIAHLRGSKLVRK